MSEGKFGPQYRLADKSSIQIVFQRGRKSRLQEMSIFYYVNSLTYSRLCITISKKNIAKAYLRNQLRRVIRESFRLRPSTLVFQDIVVVAYKAIGLLDKKQVRLLMDKQWQHLI